MNARLLPLMISLNLVSMRINNVVQPVSSHYIGESQAKIRDYLNTEPVNLRSTKEKNEYLHLAAMVLLWDLTLSNHTFRLPDLISIINQIVKEIKFR